MKIQAGAVWVYRLQVKIIYTHVNEAAVSPLVCLLYFMFMTGTLARVFVHH